MKKFIKKHRYTCILLLVFILLIVLGLKVKQVLIPDEGKATYGERLKNAVNHPISNDIYRKIDEEYAKNDKVIKISHRVQGKIINYFITVGNEVSIKDAKSFGDKLITYFDEDILDYYSIQVYLIKEDEAKNDFPIIGMKHPLSKNISWTKDRKITVSDKNEE